jgi:hypothetical protein
MKKTLFIYLPLLFIALGSCKGIEKRVVFDNKRTPLNPIAHRGYNYYQLALNHNYQLRYNEAMEKYQKDVLELTLAYNKSMEIYNQYTEAERIAQQIGRPVLLLPNEPKRPVPVDQNNFLRGVKIEGMDEGANNPILFEVELEGFEWQNPVRRIKTQKKKDNPQEVDTFYYYNADVRYLFDVTVKLPEGEHTRLSVDESRKWSNLRGRDAVDTVTAFNNLFSAIEAEEKNIIGKARTNLNTFLNSEFGTTDVRYAVNLYSFKSTKKKSYGDLDLALATAESGLRNLTIDRNLAFEQLNEAIVKWDLAGNEYRQNLGDRIKETQMKGILLNLITACTFTQNWDMGQRFMNEYSSLKLNSSDRARLDAIRIIYDDLKRRYKVMN